MAQTWADLPIRLAGSLGAVLGLIIGSYLATILVRWPGQGIGSGPPRSQCDSCQRQLRWFETVPVLSFVLLRGRCRICAARISPDSTFMELVCAIIGGMCFALGLAAMAPFMGLLLALALFDARHLWLPDRLVLVLALAALLAPPWIEEISASQRAIGGVAGFASLWLVSRLYRALRGRVGLGLGDVKLFGAIGLWTGPVGLPGVLLLACVIGIAAAAIKVAKGADAATVRLPFGTYLATATLAHAVFAMIQTRWIDLL